MNKATLIMYQYTIDHYDNMTCESYEDLDAESMADYWLRNMEENPENYDDEYYALIATPNIFRTINWDFIARKYVERRVIIDMIWNQ